MTVHFTWNEKGQPPDYRPCAVGENGRRKIADAELRFDDEPLNPLDGLSLVGITIWADKEGLLSVNGPYREVCAGAPGHGVQYRLLRPIGETENQPQLTGQFEFFIVNRFRAWAQKNPPPPNPISLSLAASELYAALNALTQFWERSPIGTEEIAAAKAALAKARGEGTRIG